MTKFHQDLRDAYKQIAADEPQRCVLIDANTDADAVSEQVWKALRDRIYSRFPWPTASNA